MSDKEIAMQITLKAMDQMAIRFSKSSNDKTETCNQKYAEQICTFYKEIFDTVSSVTVEQS